MLSAVVIAKITGDESWAEHLNPVMDAYGITTIPRQAMFLCHTAHETLGFKQLVESMRYSAKRLREVFPKYFRTDAEAEEYVGYGPEWIAEHVYGGRYGNGPEGSGDGWAFRGRGLPHLTFRDNYFACGQALGTDLTQQPQLLELRDWATAAAGWFWDSRNLNEVTDTGTLEAVTKIWNGGLNGLDDRRNRHRRILGILNAA